MPSNYHHPSWIEIDLNQLKSNIQLIRSRLGKQLFCLPVKANAYGHGLCCTALAAQEAGVDYLAVAHLQEGIQLRQANIHIPILVLGAIHENQITDLIDYELEFAISSLFKAELVTAICEKLQKTCHVHIEVDTGMQRTGVRSETAISLFHYLRSKPFFHIKGIYSHLATADRLGDAFAAKQIESFYALTQDPIFEGFPLIRHIANSAGLTNYNHSHMDMVRPSLLTLGYPSPEIKEQWPGIAPCFSLKAKVAYFKVVEAATGISYGHSHYTSRQTRIVTVPIGYGDGYRRCLSNKAHVLIRGHKFPIVGTICMDQFMVDVGSSEVHVGDEVVLIGKQGKEEISLMELADLCDTIPYEILCQFNERIPRLTLDEAKTSSPLL